MKKKLYHILDVVSNRHWVVIAKSEEGARGKVLDMVPDLDGDVRSDPEDNLEVSVAEDGDFTEITAEIKVVW